MQKHAGKQQKRQSNFESPNGWLRDYASEGSVAFDVSYLLRRLEVHAKPCGEFSQTTLNQCLTSLSSEFCTVDTSSHLVSMRNLLIFCCTHMFDRTCIVWKCLTARVLFGNKPYLYPRLNLARPCVYCFFTSVNQHGSSPAGRVA